MQSETSKCLEWKSLNGPSFTHIKSFASKRLRNNEKSPFYGWDEEKISRLLVRCGAEIATSLPIDKDHPDDLEGYLLFRELFEQKHIYFAVDGAIIVTERKPLIKIHKPNPSKRSNPAEAYGQDPTIQELPLGSPIHLSYLVENKYRCIGLLAPFQVSGLLEFCLLVLSRLGERDREHDPRRKDLHETLFPTFVGKWLISGFVSTNTTLIRIPVGPLADVLLNPYSISKFAPKRARSNPAMVFLRRGQEDLTFRESEQRICQALYAQGRHHVVAALHVYNHYWRKPGEVIHMPRERVAWYLNLGTYYAVARAAVRQLEQERVGNRPFFWHIKGSDMLFQFDFPILEEYLREQLSETRKEPRADRAYRFY